MNQTKEVGEVHCETCETGISPQNGEYFKSYEIGDWRDKHDLKKVEPESCYPVNFGIDSYVQKMKSQYYTFNTKYKSI